MAYSQVTLAQFISQISVLMDDPTAVYWTAQEITYAVWEGMRVWGAYTNYWRTRGAFTVDPSTPYYDLSIQLPAIRSRAYTLDQMVREIQFMLLEKSSGIAGSGMSGQVTVINILDSIKDARNRFVIDSRIPTTYHSVIGGPAPPDGMVEFDQTSVFVHRAGWIDSSSGLAVNLWRQDAWALDKGSPTWPIDQDAPQMYSESENSPLKLQLVPPPLNAGTVEALTVDSLAMDVTNPATTFNVPDEWSHAIKYAALSQILSSEGQIKDPLRAEYAEKRYQQALKFATDAASIIRLVIGGLPTNIDTLAAVDAGYPGWRNQYGPPILAGVLYDMVVINPGIVDMLYGAAVDVVQPAPLPGPTESIQMGLEEMDGLKDYVCHILSFKCGGREFTDSISGYDSFMANVAGRKGINAAKIQYLAPLFGQPEKEWAERPDRVQV